MPQPTASGVHVNQLLTNISIGYPNADYFADQLFPIIPVQNQSNVYASYDKSFWFRDDAKLRAPGTIPQVAGYNVTLTNSYTCVEYALSKSIPDEVRANADAPINLDREAVQFVTDKCRMRRENSFVTDFFTTSVWDADKTGGTDFTVWSNYSASSPLIDMDAFKDVIEGKIAKEPKHFICGKQVYLQLKNHPDVLDAIKYTSKAVGSEELIASLMGLDAFFVGRSIVTTTPEGTAEASVSYSRIWGKHGLLLYRPNTASLMTPSAGYTFVWNLVPNAIEFISRERDDRARTDFITGHTFFDQKATATQAGLFVSGAVA